MTTHISLGALFSSCGSCLGSSRSPCWQSQVWPLKQMHHSGGPGCRGTVCGRVGRRRGNRESRASRWETRHTYREPIKCKHKTCKSSKLCVINIAKRTWFLFFFFQVRYNHQCPKPCFQHSKERSWCYQQNTCSQSKKKNGFPSASQSDIFTFLKSNPNKAPELGELLGKPYTEEQIKKKKKKSKSQK